MLDPKNLWPLWNNVILRNRFPRGGGHCRLQKTFKANSHLFFFKQTLESFFFFGGGEMCKFKLPLGMSMYVFWKSNELIQEIRRDVRKVFVRWNGRLWNRIVSLCVEEWIGEHDIYPPPQSASEKNGTLIHLIRDREGIGGCFES